MDRIAELEKRIEQLEERLKRKKDKETNRERLARGVLIHWNESYRINFEEKYSFEKGSEYEAFDLKRVTENAPPKPSHKLRYWNVFYLKVRDLIHKQDHNPFWDELLFIAKTAVDMYANDVVRHIIERGEYVNQGGAPGLSKKSKEKIISEWVLYQENPENYHKKGLHKGTVLRQPFYTKMADELKLPKHPDLREADRTKPIERIVKKFDRQNSP